MNDPEELASALIGLWAWAQENVPTHESEIPRRLRKHLGVDPAALPVLSEELSEYDHVNVQVALDALDGEQELIGISLDHGFRVSLAELAGGSSESACSTSLVRPSWSRSTSATAWSAA